MLVPLVIEDAPAEGFVMAMQGIYLAAAPPGPAERWLMERLRQDAGVW